jgi:hypothetical protein
MQIQARNDRYIGSNNRAYARDQLTLGVVNMLGNRRAMQVEVNGIKTAFAYTSKD